MPKVASKSPKSSAKLHHTPPFSKEYTKYVDIDLSRKGRKWSNIFSLLLFNLLFNSETCSCVNCDIIHVP